MMNLTFKNESLVTENCLEPSLFGTYAPVPLGKPVDVVLGVRVAVVVDRGNDGRLAITVKLGGRSHQVCISHGSSSSASSAALLSTWMRGGRQFFPEVSVSAFTAFAMSQLGYADVPHWDNASLSSRQWRHCLQRSQLERSCAGQAIALLESLLLLPGSKLVSRLLDSDEAIGDVFRGMEGGEPRCSQDVLKRVLEMAERARVAPGAVVLADRSHSREALGSLEVCVGRAGWLILCGKRPIERHAYHLSLEAGVPVLLMETQASLRPEILGRVKRIFAFGKTEGWGVYRRRVHALFEKELPGVDCD